MRALRKTYVWPAVLIVSVGALAVTMSVAAPPDAKTGKSDRTVTPLTPSTTVSSLDAQPVKGQSAPRAQTQRPIHRGIYDMGLTVDPPIRVDYRKNPAPADTRGFQIQAIGPSPLDNRRELGAGSLAAAAVTCGNDEQCADCNVCILNTCDTSFPFGSLTCKLPEFVPPTSSQPGCDDGIACNGEERCDGNGACVAGTPPPCAAGEVCQEAPDEPGFFKCVAKCTADTDVVCNDFQACTTDTCDLVTGQCLHTNACGPGGTCTEPPNPNDAPMCDKGRCCKLGVAAPGDCSFGNTFDNCINLAGGVWLQTDNPCNPLPPSNNVNDCPDYSSGIAPQGDYGSAVGPISNLTCDTLFEIGDDYQTRDWPNDLFMEVEFLRFVGATFADASARWVITFYDETGTKVEDVFFPDGVDEQSPQFKFDPHIQTVDFDPPLTIPTKGYVTFQVQANFSPAGRVGLLPTDAEDVGLNNPNIMWVNGAPIGAADAGPLPAGQRVLSFELVGTNLPRNQDDSPGVPNGACCTGGTTPTCDDTMVSWVCEAGGGTFQGVGIACRVCGNDIFTNCTTNVDCPDSCDNDPSIDCSPAGTNGACPSGGTCVTADVAGVVCLSNFPTCQSAGCCLPDGSCQEVGSLSECTTAGGTFQGFGSDCKSGGLQNNNTGGSCCPQPTPTGGDNCSLVTLQQITIPILGDPPVTITVTGNTSGATFDDFPTWSDSAIFNPNGGTRDPGWWEGFELLGGVAGAGACADIRLDLCCSDIAGNPVRPAWGNLWFGCPEIRVFGNAGVDKPIGVGRGTSGFARGEPFCDGDNLWQTYTNKRPGRYYYPILSFPGSTCGSPPGCTYQFHVTVAACPIAACCTGEGCTVTNELNCNDAGGYWLHASNTGGNTVVNCGSGTINDPFVCAIGSCCLGPGSCEDRASAQAPCDPANPATCMDKALCDILPRDDGNGTGTYVGGALCSNPTPPCPICDIAGTANCSLPDLSVVDFWQMSDLTMLPDGHVTADDFVASTTTISTVCAWGIYTTRNSQNADDQDDGVDCSADVVDDFRVRIYEDNNGRPGALFAESSVSPANMFKARVKAAIEDSAIPNIRIFEYLMKLDTPLGSVNPLVMGTRYWLEIANNTFSALDPTVPDNTCLWRHLNAEGGNQYSANGTETGGYLPGSERADVAADKSWCVDQSVTIPPADVGLCCLCGGSCTASILDDCAPGNQWVGPGQPAPPAVVPNDLCDNAIDITGNQVLVATDTSCVAELDSAQNRPDHGTVKFGGSIWYRYTATCTGKVVVSMCGTGNADNTYDSALAVYDGGTCPTATSSAIGGSLNDIDEGCDNIADGGSGVLSPAASVKPGDQMIIRVGGFEGDKGRGLLSVGCLFKECKKRTPLEPLIVGFPRNRNLAVTMPAPVTQPPFPEVLRVKFVSLPPPFNVVNGKTMFVGTPKEICQNSGNGPGVPLDQCGATLGQPGSGDICQGGTNDGTPCPAGDSDCTGGGVCTFNQGPTLWVAGLQCDPVAFDWTTIPELNISSEFIVPGGSYIIQAAGADCLLDKANSYSAPLSATTSDFGDVIGGPFTLFANRTPPNGVVGITSDVTKILNMFSNLEKAAGKGVSDLVPAAIDQKIGIADVTAGLDAFGSEPFPFGPPSPLPACLIPIATSTSSSSSSK